MRELWYEPFKCSLPEADEGNWRIRRGFIDEAENNRSFQFEHEVPGTDYRVLQKREKDGWVTYMADSANEVGDALPFVSRAYGHVLITGLGLGILPKMLATKKNVASITIIENAPEVIELVKYELPDRPQLRVILADAFIYRPWRKFDCAFHDVWPVFGREIIEETESLFDRYDKYVNDFQMGWLYELNCVIDVYESLQEKDKAVSAEAATQKIYDQGSGEKLNDYIRAREKAKDPANWDTKTVTKVGHPSEIK